MLLTKIFSDITHKISRVAEFYPKGDCFMCQYSECLMFLKQADKMLTKADKLLLNLKHLPTTKLGEETITTTEYDMLMAQRALHSIIDDIETAKNIKNTQDEDLSSSIINIRDDEIPF